jgi:hypothetical protein
MKHMRGLGVIGGVVFWLALSAPPVSAQWFADLDLGGAYTKKSEVTVKSPAGDTTFGVTATEGEAWLLGVARPGASCAHDHVCGSGHRRGSMGQKHEERRSRKLLGGRRNDERDDE